MADDIYSFKWRAANWKIIDGEIEIWYINSGKCTDFMK